MNVFLPENIFTKLIVSILSKEDELNLKFLPAALLSKHVSENQESIGLIPTLDIINHTDFYVSKSLGISFDESISNAYIYFEQKEKVIKEIVLAGDVCTNEVILTKILFKETYGVEVDLFFEKTNGSSSSKSKVLVGDRNFIEGDLSSAISFTEEIIELISAPYVNFVFSSKSESLLKNFHSKYFEKILEFNPFTILETLRNNISMNSKNYLLENLQHVMFNLNEQDLEGIKQLFQLPYFHGIIKDMIDVKYV